MLSEYQQKELAELTDWETNGLLEGDEIERLAELRRIVYEAELDASGGNVLSLDRLDRFESEERNIHRALFHLAKEIMKVRGEEPGDHAYSYCFYSYERDIASDHHKHYPKGTRLISVTIKISQRYEPDFQTITFPESYLSDDNWLVVEQDKLAAKKAAAQVECENRAREREARERDELARLQAKYGDAA